MTAIEPRSQRAEIAALEYDGPESLTDAAHLRERMAAGAELAKRAGLDAREYLWTAREAERALGRMIVAARQAGDLKDGTGPPEHLSDGTTISTLADLGISRDLAAHAAALAKVPDEVWAEWHADDQEATRSAVSGTVRRYLAAVESARAGAAAAQREADEIRREREALAARLRKISEQDTLPAVPPLAEDETSTAGFGIALAAAVPEAPNPAPKPDPAGRAQDNLILRIDALAAEITRHDPVIVHDEWRDASVMAARAAARRLTDALASWTRQLNALYQEGIPHE